MDVTTIQCGKATRDRLRKYKAKNDFENYDDAINDLLDRTE
jgi:hypothetical protein